MNVENCKAYTLVERQELKDLNSIGYLMEHKKTKARVALIENDDSNKVFCIGFRTPPKDSTGVAHIVEHTVLCGSKDFPVKDPFTELAKGSLNTFLNAMTYPDKTVYPVASCNDKDFKNLMHVYLDAVFFPNIYREEKIFRQEGWHYEMESVEGPLTYNGVVFNEMKGVFSSPDQVLARDIQQSLYPDTAYGVESGGDPIDIPNLTYEAYLDFHRKYYHPSNSYLYLYGDMDMEEKLNWIDENYLGQFDFLAVDSELSDQKPFEKRRDKYGFYSAAEGEQIENKAYFSYNFALGDSLDPKLYRAFRVLDHVLVDSVGAPLKQALLDKGLGTEIDSLYETSIKQPFFSVLAKNVNSGRKEEFLETVTSVLQSICQEGLNQKSLQAALNSMEFQTREADYGSYPKGLMYGLQMFDSWLYDDRQPFVHICPNETFKQLKELMDTGYFEDLIRKYFLENPHTTFVSVEPKIGLTAKMDEEERLKLEQYKDSLSLEQREEVVRQTSELKAYQEEKDDPELLKCIPLLEREDIGKKARPFTNEEKQIHGCPALHHRVFTNGINYIRLAFDVWDLREYTPYLSFLTELIGFMDTDRHDKLELSNEILLHAGGYSISADVYSDRKTRESKMNIEVAAKVLYSETGYVLDLIREILLTTHLNDEKRLREIIREIRSDKQTSMVAAGHSTAAFRGLSYISDRHRYVEQTKGIDYYEFICYLDDHFEECKEDLVRILSTLAREIFVEDRLLISVTSDDEGFACVEKEMEKWCEKLPKRTESELPKEYWRAESNRENEGFKTSSRVQYVARVGDYAGKGIPYCGSYKVVKTILGYEYLWNSIRVKGGAYGVMCSFLDMGYGFFVSYRDPHLSATNEVYKGVPEYLRTFQANERDMMKYVIGTISDMDTPLTPRAVGERSFAAYMTNMTEEDKQRERDEVLATDQEKVREAAKVVEAILSDEKICVIGGEEKVQRAENLFECIRVLK